MVVVGWSGLAILCAAIGTRRHEEEAWWLGYADALAGLGAVAILVNLAPLDRLVVDANRTSAVVPFLNEATVAIASVAAALVVSSRLHPRQRWSPLRVILAAVVGVYLLSVGVVDLFQARLGGSVGEEELAKQAQVALSVLWAVLGASAFTIGLVRDLPGARQAGLVLLGLVDGEGLPGRPGRPGRRLPGAVAAGAGHRAARQRLPVRSVQAHEASRLGSFGLRGPRLV